MPRLVNCDVLEQKIYYKQQVKGRKNAQILLLNGEME